MQGQAPRLDRPFRSLRLRVPATAMAVFAISLAVAAVLAYELLLQDGRRDIDVVLAREQERFELSITELLIEAQQDDPQASPVAALRTAVRRYLQLNPSTEYYWTIVTFEDGQRYAATNGPPELEPLYRADELPSGRLNVRETIPTDAGDIRTSTVPVHLGDELVATLQLVSPLEPVRTEAFEAAGLVAAAAGVSLLLGGILLTASLWRSLAPLGALAGAARSTELRSLDSRVDEPDTADEVGILAREFNTMLDRLDEASAAQREFMASIGHELRTPITVARGHLELLETMDGNDPEAVAETVTILRDELTRMGRLVEDVMAIARVDMDDFVRPRDVELVQWFEELELRLSGLGAASETRIDPPPPVLLHADPDRLAQAVLNLVTNAYLHTPAGTRVRISARLAEAHVVIAVEDDGPGIPEAIRDDAFAPFIHAGEAPSSTGLGLSVVKAVVTAHGGDISLDTGSSGTRVELHLPWTPTTPDDVPAEDDPTDTLELAIADPAETNPALRLRRPS